MSFFNLTRAKEDKPVTQSAETPTTATRARELPLPVDIFEGSDELLLLALNRIVRSPRPGLCLDGHDLCDAPD